MFDQSKIVSNEERSIDSSTVFGLKFLNKFTYVQCPCSNYSYAISVLYRYST